MGLAAEVRYARVADGAHLAYAIFGDGPLDLVEVGNGTNISFEAASDQPRWAAFLERVGSFARVVRFDARGIGLSDPVGASPATVERWADDTVAIVEAAGSVEPALVATGHAGPVALFLAATRPEMIRAVVLINTYARLLRAPDYPHGIPSTVFDRFVDLIVDPGTDGVSNDNSMDDLPLMAPSRVGDTGFQQWWRQAGHRGASPATARAMHLLAGSTDVRAVLERVSAPTLVLHSRDNNYVRAAHGRYLVEHLAHATYIEMDSADHLPWVGDTDFVGEIEEFLTGTRNIPPTNRRLATVVFTDIVHSTDEVQRLGDRHWRDRLDQHDQVATRQVLRFGGRVVKTTGDGLLATFDGPARAIECANTIRDAVAQLGITIRAGLHAGEIEQRGNDIAGIAVHTAQRICSAAEPGETLVSRTVADLVAGSGISFVDRGEHTLKGLHETWHLYRANT
jgi:class 3 adenylate cyclase